MNDFVTDDNREYKFKLGRIVASSLSGFIAGAVGGAVVAYLLVVAQSA